MNTIQYFNSDRFGLITFKDKRHSITSAKAHPRDIEILEGNTSDKAKAEIAIDIRIGQGVNPIGVAKGLRF